MRSGTQTYSAKAPMRRNSRRGNADHFAVVAQVHLPTPAEETLAAIHGGIEGDAVAAAERRTALPTASTTPAASWPMTIGGSRRPVLPS